MFRNPQYFCLILKQSICCTFVVRILFHRRIWLAIGQREICYLHQDLVTGKVVNCMGISCFLGLYIFVMKLLFFDRFAFHHCIIIIFKSLMMLYTMQYHQLFCRKLLMKIYEFWNNQQVIGLHRFIEVGGCSMVNSLWSQPF